MTVAQAVAQHPARTGWWWTVLLVGAFGFYWFSLQAAPSDGIHEMTPGELSRYGVLTRPIGN